MLRKKLREVLIRAALRAKGYTDEQIDDVYRKIEADTGRPILDWLSDGGFEMILKLIVTIIGLFAGAGITATDAPSVMQAMDAAPMVEQMAFPDVKVRVTLDGLVITIPLPILRMIVGPTPAG